MANQITRILDTITPEIYNAYMQKYTDEKSAFVRSGIAVADERVSKNITSGGKLVNMPFWNDLDGDDEVLGDGDKALETGKITSGADIATVLYRGRGWAVNELAAVMSGDDPVGAVLSRIGDYWVRREQAVLLSVLKGIFDGTAGTLKDTNVLDAKTKKIDASMILDAKQMLGDSASQLQAIAMHSAVYTDLQKQNLITTIPSARGEIMIDKYLGYEVIIDDGIAPEGDVYTSYLFKRGAIGRNFGQPDELTTFETARDAAKGNDMVYTRRAFVMHPYGVKWTAAELDNNEVTPSNATLAKVANWSRVYDVKKLGIIAMKHKIK